MTRLVIYLSLSLAVALGAAWLMSLPGTISIDLGTHRLQPGLGLAIVVVIGIIVLSILLWALLQKLFGAPGALARHRERRKREAGLQALSDGFIALQAGENGRARSLAQQARSKLPQEAAPKLLEARAELALGDYSAAREHYRDLVADPRTALAALSGLYRQARLQNRPTAALTFARKAVGIAPGLDWASDAVFEDLAARGAWEEALAMVESQPSGARAARAAKKRRQGVLEAALAIAHEETDPETALARAEASLRKIPDFVPAALVAARIQINRDDTRKASSLLRRVWRATGHPDVALLYAHVRPGASALERLKRLKGLIEDPGNRREAALVLAGAAIEAHEWALARDTLAPHLEAPTQKTCLLMAEIEEGESGDRGKAREWLARAVHAAADPAWTADGVVSEDWAPVSPVTGRLDAFEWKVPVAIRTSPLLESAATPVEGPARPPAALPEPAPSA